METEKILMGGFKPSVVDVVRKHIDQKGMPSCKENCPLREAICVSNKHGAGKRTTWCCKARTGLFLSEWRCVGLDDNRCLFKVANDPVNK